MVTEKRHPPSWQVAEAKARLSELLSEAARAPQTIERRGTPVAVVLGIDDYRAATASVDALSAEARMRRFLATSAAIGAAGGETLRTGRRIPRASPFRGGR